MSTAVSDRPSASAPQPDDGAGQPQSRARQLLSAVVRALLTQRIVLVGSHGPDVHPTDGSEYRRRVKHSSG